MKCYRKNGSDCGGFRDDRRFGPSMKCYRKNGSDQAQQSTGTSLDECPQ